MDIFCTNVGGQISHINSALAVSVRHFVDVIFFCASAACCFPNMRNGIIDILQFCSLVLWILQSVNSITISNYGYFPKKLAALNPNKQYVYYLFFFLAAWFWCERKSSIAPKWNKASVIWLTNALILFNVYIKSSVQVRRIFVLATMRGSSDIYGWDLQQFTFNEFIFSANHILHSPDKML